jgi:hypothetical protein
MNPVMMSCGHASNAMHVNSNGTKIPSCVICGCIMIDESFAVSEGREAKCGYCGKTTASKLELPFFKACPDKPYDEYYCGCWGWD